MRCHAGMNWHRVLDTSEKVGHTAETQREQSRACAVLGHCHLGAMTWRRRFVGGAPDPKLRLLGTQWDPSSSPRSGAALTNCNCRYVHTQ